MKRTTLFLLATLAICSCQEEKLNISTLETSRFTASIEDNYSGGLTKTSLDEHGNVLWTKGDKVSIFAGNTVNEQYQVTDDSDGKTSASLDRVASSGFVAGSEIDNNVAYYPYASGISIVKNETDYVISDIVLPSTQCYAEASFANGAFPMAAVTASESEKNLKFKNVLGGLKLQLKGTASIASISVKGNSNEKLCGAASVTVSAADVPAIALTDASSTSVTLDCGTGVQLDSETATSFIIALPPMTMASGFTVTVKDTDGKQMEIKTVKSQTIARSSLLKMTAVEYVGEESGDDSGDESGEIDYLKEPFTITSVGETSVLFVKSGSPADITLEYRKNSDDWAAYTIGDAIALADGDALQFRAGESGNTTLANSTLAYYQVVIQGDGKINVSGNIISLLDGMLSRQSLSEYGFYRLFFEQTELVNATNLKLPVTILSDYCYSEMFYGCANLITTPELPATTLANCCYRQMFHGCTSLTTAPELPATILAQQCYQDMFGGCKNLMTAPELPATTLAQECYSTMFQECIGLKAAPKLQAMTLAVACYAYMFQGCTGLTIAPELPATTLAINCYGHMFQGCTGLTAAPELQAVTLVRWCYNYMFKDCSKLKYVKALFTTTPATSTNPVWSDTTSNTRDWLSGVSSTGTFVKSKNATWNVTGTYGVPTGWTVRTE